MSMYALQVMTGMEAEITQKLRGKGVDARCPQERRMIRRGGKWQEQLYTLFPSYIFVSTPDVYRVYYPDPWAFNRCHYDAARKTLYIFDELTRLRTSNEETAKLVQQRIESWESVTADSAEMKSCADYRAFGILCREAVKGPGSVNQSMKWLQGLTAIVIDPHRCPDTAKEFSEYEYEVGRGGTVLPGYVDADNHHIDAVRYAVNRIWMRRGA